MWKLYQRGLVTYLREEVKPRWSNGSWRVSTWLDLFTAQNPWAFKKVTLTAYGVADCIVGLSLFSLNKFLKIRHCTCFFLQESQTAAPTPVEAAVPRTSLCCVQSAPPPSASEVSGPLGTEKCLEKVMFFLPCPFCCVLPSYYFILTK